MAGGESEHSKEKKKPWGDIPAYTPTHDHTQNQCRSGVCVCVFRNVHTQASVTVSAPQPSEIHFALKSSRQNPCFLLLLPHL